MPTFSQSWTCTACGHVKLKTVRYPKYFPSSTPLTEMAKRAKCSVCGAKGQCTIKEIALGGRAEKGE
jgi:transcription elongation factor Elf1